MKTSVYKKIIEAYDTKYGAVRANLTYEMLCKIKIPIFTPKEKEEFIRIQKNVQNSKKKLLQERKMMNKYLTSFID